jgi:hypothetical protein
MSNASQQQNSLLTGKLTGKIAKLGLTQQRDRHLIQQPRGFLAKFPAEINREKFRQNREAMTR